MRISRPCYDKPRRCPGWAGGGWRYATETRCQDGTIPDAYEGRLWRLRAHRCPECGVLVLPLAVQWFDWHHYPVMISVRADRIRLWWRDRKGTR